MVQIPARLHVQLSWHNTLNPMRLTMGLLVPCTATASQLCDWMNERLWETLEDTMKVLKGRELVEVCQVWWSRWNSGYSRGPGPLPSRPGWCLMGLRGQMFTCWSHFSRCTFMVMTYNVRQYHWPRAASTTVQLSSAALTKNLLPLKTEHETPRCETAYM